MNEPIEPEAPTNFIAVISPVVASRANVVALALFLPTIPLGLILTSPDIPAEYVPI